VQKVITGTIHAGDFETLKQLMRDWSSCMRYAYQRIHKLAGRGLKIALTVKAYSYLKYLYKVIEIKTPAVTPPCLTPVLGNYGTG